MQLEALFNIAVADVSDNGSGSQNLKNTAVPEPPSHDESLMASRCSSCRGVQGAQACARQQNFNVSDSGCIRDFTVYLLACRSVGWILKSRC